MSLKPWREVIHPHKDVLEGTFQESEFAADINKVANCIAPPEYQDPELFFERTYITEGMSLLLNSVIRRLTGKGGDPVVQIKTAFGGGKTHSMLAVYHMAKTDKPVSNLSGIPQILDSLGIVELPNAQVAVLDGNALSVSQPRKHGSVIANTLWGEIAWQLGKEEGYAMVAESDTDGTSPGKDVLSELFKKYSPCLILMDEMVSYVRQFDEGQKYAGGTFASQMSFLQALTEAASQVPTAMVLATLPESNLELGGQRGKETLNHIEKTFGRIEAIWKPVSTEEGFEIVRRRLFQPVLDANTRDDVCRAFAEIYPQGGGSYPSDTHKSTYLDKLRTAYPIHPEVFERLYTDWSSLEKFQRTRGVLRLMAMVIFRLWKDGNQDFMILPGSLPLYDTDVRNELIRYLPAGWEPVMEKDVDGQNSEPSSVDEKNPMIGSVQAARRVARCVFLGSAPTVTAQKVRGIDITRIRLGCIQPDQQVGRYDDALKHLVDKLHYLYSGKERYWYDTRPNLRREMEDRLDWFSTSEHLIPEMQKRLRTLIAKGPFAGVHVFTSHADVPDDTSTRLVVLSPIDSHKRKDKKSNAIKTAQTIKEQRGQQPRLNQNQVIFLAADGDMLGNLISHTKRFLAWDSIVNDIAILNLDQYQTKEAKQNRADASGGLDAALKEAYRWIIAPAQEVQSNGNVSELFWEEQRVSSMSDDMMSAISKTVQENELLIQSWSPIHLGNVLKTWFWKGDRKDCSVMELWEAFCRYPYLQRLGDLNVLKSTIEEGIKSDDFFGYATSVENGKYTGLKLGTPGMVYMDKSSVLVQLDAAKAQVQAEQTVVPEPRKTEETTQPKAGDERNPYGTSTGGNQPEQKLMKRFHGSVDLDPVKASLDFSKIVEEVVQHFSSELSSKVKITVEIEANMPKGIKEHIQRAVKENCNTLKFNIAEFEEE